jgi:hypothetical protein
MQLSPSMPPLRYSITSWLDGSAAASATAASNTLVQFSACAA